MADTIFLIEGLAALIDYPREQTREELRAVAAGLRDGCPAAAEALAGLSRLLEEQPVWSAQELYTQTFDLQPTCSLNVGYYLFGEDYQRGMFLAHLRQSQEEAGMGVERELPDHVPVVLRWLARVYGSELYLDMLTECLLPVLGKMDEALAPSPLSGGTEGGPENPYRGVLQAISLFLIQDLEARGITLAPSIPSTQRPELPMLTIPDGELADGSDGSDGLDGSDTNPQFAIRNPQFERLCGGGIG